MDENDDGTVTGFTVFDRQNFRGFLCLHGSPLYGNKRNYGEKWIRHVRLRNVLLILRKQVDVQREKWEQHVQIFRSSASSNVSGSNRFST